MAFRTLLFLAGLFSCVTGTTYLGYANCKSLIGTAGAHLHLHWTVNTTAANIAVNWAAADTATWVGIGISNTGCTTNCMSNADATAVWFDVTVAPHAEDITTTTSQAACATGGTGVCLDVSAQTPGTADVTLRNASRISTINTIEYTRPYAPTDPIDKAFGPGSVVVIWCKATGEVSFPSGLINLPLHSQASSLTLDFSTAVDECTSPYPTPTPTNPTNVTSGSSSNGVNQTLTIIVAAVVGGVVLIAIIVVAIVFSKKLAKKKRRAEEARARDLAKRNATGGASATSTGYPAPAVEMQSSDSFRPAASGGNTGGWSVGDKCQAVWSEDKQWYDAKLEEFDPTSQHWLVTFTEYGNQEWVAISNLK